jgi:hypothetical protein
MYLLLILIGCVLGFIVGFKEAKLKYGENKSVGNSKSKLR